jgi:hypothetical protein
MAQEPPWTTWGGQCFFWTTTSHNYNSIMLAFTVGRASTILMCISPNVSGRGPINFSHNADHQERFSCGQIISSTSPGNGKFAVLINNCSQRYMRSRGELISRKRKFRYPQKQYTFSHRAYSFQRYYCYQAEKCLYFIVGATVQFDSTKHSIEYICYISEISIQQARKLQQLRGFQCIDAFTKIKWPNNCVSYVDEWRESVCNC